MACLRQHFHDSGPQPRRTYGWFADRHVRMAMVHSMLYSFEFNSILDLN